jgi:hypothetical protein
MAAGANSTIISVVGGGVIDKKDIAVMSANGGISVYETDKNIYVNAVKEEFINQRVINEFGGPVTQIINTAQPYLPGGTDIGQIQFLQSPGLGNAATKFDAVNELKFNPTTSALTVFGDVETTIGNVNIVNGNLFATNGEVSSDTLTVANTSTLERLSVSGVASFANTVNIGTSGTKRTLTVEGNIVADNLTISNSVTVTSNVSANNISVGNIVAANLFTGTITTNAQPNVTSVATTLTVGNLELYGNTNNVHVQAANDKPLIMGVYNTGTSANYDLTLTTTGNLILPVSSTGNAVLSEKTANGVLIITGVAGHEYHFDESGVANLADSVVANYFTGKFSLAANAQPNITSVGTLTGLTVGNATANTVFGNGTITSTDTIIANVIGNTTSNIVGNFANFANANISGNINVTSNVNTSDLVATGNVTISGNLYVQGNTNYVDVENLNVEDPIISLGGGANGTAASTDGDRGLWLRSSVSDKFMGWANASNGNANSVTTFVVASNASVTGNTVTVNTLGDIKANQFIGSFSGTSSANIVNGNSSVNVAANSNVVISANGVANVLTVTGTGANITGTANITGNLVAANVSGGNLVTANNFTGNLVDGTSKVSVATSSNITLTVASTDTLLVTSNSVIVTGTANISNNVIAPNFVGNLANGTSKIAITANGNITMTSGGVMIANANSAVFGVSGNITATGNITTTANVVATDFNGALSNGTSNVSIPAADGDVWITASGNNTMIITGIEVNVTGNLNVSDTLVTGNFTVANTFTIGNAITTAETTFALVNANVTTLNMAGAATAINIGASTGTLTVNNPTVVGSQTTQNLFNTVATTLNIGGEATTVSIGNTSGTTTIGNALAVIGNLSVVGGGLTTNATTFTVANTNATTVNIGGSATAITMGATTGTLTVNNPTVVGSQTTQNLFNTVATTLNIGGEADIKLSTSGKTTNVAGNLNVVGTTTISDDGNLYIKGGNIGEYLKANAANGQTIWANVNWSDLGTNDSTRGPTSIALGQGAAASANRVSIGENAGSGGGSGVFLGANAGTSGSIISGSIEINASGTGVTPTATQAGLYVKPVRNATSDNFTKSLVYDLATGEIGYSTAGATTALTAGTVTTAAQPNITSVGTLANLYVGAVANAVGFTANTGVFSGNGANLTNLTGANVTGQVPYANIANSVAGANVTGTVGSATTAGTVTTAAQGNITSLGILTGLGVNGTITASAVTANTGLFTGDGAGLSNINIANINNALTFTGPVTNNGVTLDAANVGTIDITINGTTYTLYAVPKP